jgi:catechol 2,3-dioxygenase-like lactoylglutathione lyase family enzyme
MRIRRISFLGVRTEHVDEMTAFVRDVLGLTPAFANPGWTGFRLGSGARDLFEIYGPSFRDERLFPSASGGPVAAFDVDDLVVARAELEAADSEIIGDIVWAAEVSGNPEQAGWGWLFFRAPDGNVYVLQQDQPVQ